MILILQKLFVLVRIYKLNPEHIKLINEITYATKLSNSYKFKKKDLKSNDDIQKSLIQVFLSWKRCTDSTYTYKPKRDEIISKVLYP